MRRALRGGACHSDPPIARRPDADTDTDRRPRIRQLHPLSESFILLNLSPCIASAPSSTGLAAGSASALSSSPHRSHLKLSFTADSISDQFAACNCFANMIIRLACHYIGSCSSPLAAAQAQAQVKAAGGSTPRNSAVGDR